MTTSEKWHAIFGAGEVRRDPFDDSGRAYLVARVFPGQNAMHDSYQERIDANARLIAAAPELVAALEAIKNELGVPQPGYPQPVANAYQLADDALARVRGESEGGEG